MTSPLSAPGRLALSVRHRLRLRRMPGRLGWLASLHIKPPTRSKFRIAVKKHCFLLTHKHDIIYFTFLV